MPLRLGWLVAVPAAHHFRGLAHLGMHGKILRLVPQRNQQSHDGWPRSHAAFYQVEGAPGPSHLGTGEGGVELPVAGCRFWGLGFGDRDCAARPKGWIVFLKLQSWFR